MGNYCDCLKRINDGPSKHDGQCGNNEEQLMLLRHVSAVNDKAFKNSGNDEEIRRSNEFYERSDNEEAYFE